MGEGQPINIGDSVKEAKDNHIGRVVSIDLKRNECYVYWHKGYSSWVKCYDLVAVHA